MKETELAQNLRYEPEYDFEAKRITLKPGFTNKISTRDKTNSLVIDILNKNVDEIFKGFNHVVIKLYNDEVIIEPLKEEKEQQSLLEFEELCSELSKDERLVGIAIAEQSVSYPNLHIALEHIKYTDIKDIESKIRRFTFHNYKHGAYIEHCTVIGREEVERS